MMDIVKDIDKDINRCKNVLNGNDYLEIVIAIEELNDKYKEKISELSNTENQVVWNYNKKDLQQIEKRLITYKENLIKDKKEEDFKLKLDEIKLYLENNNVNDKEKVKEEIKNIENIYKEEISIDEKWNKIRCCIELFKNLDAKVSSYLLEIILLIIK